MYRRVIGNSKSAGSFSGHPKLDSPIFSFDNLENWSV